MVALGRAARAHGRRSASRCGDAVLRSEAGRLGGLEPLLHRQLVLPAHPAPHPHHPPTSTPGHRADLSTAQPRTALAHPTKQMHRTKKVELVRR